MRVCSFLPWPSSPLLKRWATARIVWPPPLGSPEWSRTSLLCAHTHWPRRPRTLGCCRTSSPLKCLVSVVLLSHSFSLHLISFVNYLTPEGLIIFLIYFNHLVTNLSCLSPVYFVHVRSRHYFHGQRHPTNFHGADGQIKTCVC